MSISDNAAQNECRQYKQVKLSADPAIAAAFKAACAASNVSMASVLSGFMADYSAVAAAKGRRLLPDYSSRRKRRAAIRKILRQLEQIREAECRYQDSIPQNLQNSTVFDNSEEFLNFLDEAVDALESIATA